MDFTVILRDYLARIPADTQTEWISDFHPEQMASAFMSADELLHSTERAQAENLYTLSDLSDLSDISENDEDEKELSDMDISAEENSPSQVVFF